MEEKKPFLRRYGSSFFVLAGIAILCGLVHLLVVLLPAFADLLGSTIGAAIRGALAHLTGWIPLSLYESIILLLPVGLTVLIVCMVKFCKRGESKRATRLLCGAISVLLWIYATFVLAFCPGYHGTTLDVKLELPRKEVTTSELKATAEWLARETNALSTQVTYLYGGASNMPYDLDTMCEKLNDAYAKLGAEMDFLPSLRAPIKYVANSEFMSYTHITGVYSFFTGEANLNIAFPDYTLPFTAAHEMAHQRGVAREDEANFVAFLVCAASDDPYIRYSGYYELFLYVANQLYKADTGAHSAVLGTLESRVKGEMGSYVQFFQKYEDSTVGTISGAVNDAYLKGQGQTEGTKSYGLVADLAVQYYLTNIKGT